MKNKNFLLFIIGVSIIMGLAIYAFYVFSTQKGNRKNVNLISLTKAEVAQECLNLLEREKSLTPRINHLVCGESETGRVISLKSDEEIIDYLKTNNLLAVAFDLKNVLTIPLNSIRFPEEKVTYLTPSVHVCAFVYPDFSEKRGDWWEMFPQEVSKSVFKLEINYSACTKYFNWQEFPKFVIVGKVVKEGSLFEKLKTADTGRLQIELNLLNTEKEYSEGSLAGYFLREPMQFIPFYRVIIPLK